MSSPNSSTATPQPDTRGRPKLATLQSTSSSSLVSPPAPQGSHSKKGKLKANGRSSSHNKLNKLSSTTAAPLARPNLNRSKSTDGLTRNKPGAALKRNPRSFTKTAGLFQPLTKSSSSTSIKPNKSTTSLKGLTNANAGLKTSGRKGRAILRLNEDNDNDNYEDLGTAKPDPKEYAYSRAIEHDLDQDQDHPQLQQQEQELPPLANAYFNPALVSEKSFSSLPEVEIVEGLPKEKTTELTKENSHTGSINSSNQSHEEPKQNPNLQSNISTRSSNDDFSNNLYGGSLLLSQSTGLTKKIDNRNSTHSNQKLLGTEGYPGNYKGYPQFMDQASTDNSESPGISFNTNSVEQQNANKIAEPVITNKNAVQNNSYQPNQTIFNNLQRTNSQYLSSKRQQAPGQIQIGQNQKAHQQQLQQHLQNLQIQTGFQNNEDGVTNFSDFLNNTNAHGPTEQQSSPNNIKTRAQQRLWLQRENSLLDISMLDPTKLNNFSNLSLSNLMFAQNYANSLQAKELAITPGGMSQQQALNFFSNHSSGSAGTGDQFGGLADGTSTNGSARTTALSSARNMQQMQQATTPGTTAPAGPRTDNSMSNINGLLLMFQNSNSIQSRTEFERLNREYLNVRRNLNPVGESIDRTEKYLQSIGHSSLEIDVTKLRKNTESPSNSTMLTGNKFEDVSTLYPEKEQEVNMTLNRLWQEAAVSIALPAAAQRVATQPNLMQQLQMLQQQPQQQRPTNQRLASFNQNQNSVNHLRAPQAPTTRAVKLQGKRGETLTIN